MPPPTLQRQLYALAFIGFQCLLPSFAIAEQPRVRTGDEVHRTTHQEMLLHVEGNQILDASKKRWQGRGANLQDTRSCESCLIHHDVNEVLRRIDALVDDWRATFIRLTMENYTSSGVLSDPEYLRDLTKIIDHVGTKKDIYVMLAMWHDPALHPKGWSKPEAAPIWQSLVRHFGDRPYVMFGLTNEPEGAADGRDDVEVWQSMNALVHVIRKAEHQGGYPQHLISVQATRNWGRELTYYLNHPIQAGSGQNIIYETHIYDKGKDFERLLVEPAKTLPVVIGEFGPIHGMTLQDCSDLITLANRLQIPYLAWTFHSSCAPNLIQNRSEHTCSIGQPLVPTIWGKLLMDALKK